MCPKIHTEKKEYESPEEVQVLKILISTGDSYFKIQSLKVGINRQPLYGLIKIPGLRPGIFLVIAVLISFHVYVF